MYLGRLLWHIPILSALCFTSHTAKAGWASGGSGGILEDGLNPWFLDNEPPQGMPALRTVRYCVMKGPDFTQTMEELQAEVQGALSFWHNEISAAYVPENFHPNMPSPQKVKVKSSGFTPVSCLSEQVDLAFQFGVLSEQQEKNLHEQNIITTDHVGFAMRESYDKKLLRGRGYIYISPDHGPKKFKNIREDDLPWDSIFNLQFTLRHELGHVFGLPHEGGRYSIMSATFPEALVLEKKTSEFIRSISYIFHPQFPFLETSYLMDDYEHAVTREFFSITGEQATLILNFRWDHLVISHRGEKIARVGFATQGERRYQDMIYLWLPPEQIIFPVTDTHKQIVLVGPQAVEIQNQGLMYFADPQTPPRPVAIQLGKSGFQLSGFHRGKIITSLLPGSRTNPWIKAPYDLAPMHH